MATQNSSIAIDMAACALLRICVSADDRWIDERSHLKWIPVSSTFGTGIMFLNYYFKY
jgi:hypothetical protein